MTVENARQVEDLMEVEFMPCPTCSQVTVVEVPPCPDEHGFDCPDRACTMCGTALTIAGVVMGEGAMIGDTRAAGVPRRAIVSTRAATRSVA